MSSHSRGSTIIEVMAAVVIFGCAVTVLIPSYLTAITAAETQTQYIEALTVLDNEFVRFIKQGFVPKDLNEKKLISEASSRFVYEVHATAYPVDGRRINLLNINVSWSTGRDHFRNVDLASYVFDAENQQYADHKK